ncbi:MAG: hypothetical protein CBARDMAM_0995 [uncultured Caballeronia sp.]|nr:MAG: hypothetical protein CBARDMAM_0995 [uncultured Caballeronia sp.]
MSQGSVHIRLDRDEYDYLKDEARKRKVSPNALVRVFVRDGLAKFDRRNDALMVQIDALINLVTKSNILAASAVVSAALPVGLGATLDEGTKAQMRNHIMETVKLGHNISSTYNKGTFDQGDANISSN